MRPWMFLMSLLAGCMAGPNEETLIDELRLVNLGADRPAIIPGEPVVLEAVVAGGAGADLAVWMCTGGPCFELADGGAIADVSAVSTLDDAGTAMVEIGSSPALFAWLAIAEERGFDAQAQVWALACEPGVCPLIDSLASPPDAGTAEHDALAETLASSDFMAELPLETASLSQRGVALIAPGDERNANPELSLVSEAPTEMAPEAELELEFDVADEVFGEALVYGYASAGGFGRPGYKVVDGTATLSFFAPEEPGEVQLWVVAEDGLGGSDVWQATVLVTGE